MYAQRIVSQLQFEIDDVLNKPIHSSIWLKIQHDVLKTSNNIYTLE